jgi:hypothetical protein
MALATLQTLFQDAFPAYEQTHPLPPHVRRDAALGGHIQACPDGHVARVWSNSCRQRSCPQGASLQTARGLAVQRARLLACDHYHVIFTLPHTLNPLWLANVAVMTTRVFQAVRATLVELLADPKYLGAQPGIIAALHTWSQTLVLHPPYALPGHWRRADTRRILEGRPQWLSPSGTSGHGRLSGQAARRHPAGFGL